MPSNLGSLLGCLCWTKVNGSVNTMGNLIVRLSSEVKINFDKNANFNF